MNKYKRLMPDEPAAGTILWLTHQQTQPARRAIKTFAYIFNPI